MGSKKTYQLKRPVFFIGFMGAGKTTVTRRLARMCGLASVDVDRCLERAFDMRAKELFLQCGEERFRELEACQLEELVEGDPLLISCGGGIVMGARSREIIRTRGFAVYLKVTPEESASRISDHSTRPYLESMDSFRAASSVRLPYYEQLADVTVDTKGASVGKLAWDIRCILLKRGVLCQTSK